MFGQKNHKQLNINVIFYQKLYLQKYQKNSSKKLSNKSLRSFSLIIYFVICPTKVLIKVNKKRNKVSSMVNR